MSRPVAAMLLVACTISVAACGSDSGSDEPSTEPVSSAPAPSPGPAPSPDEDAAAAGARAYFDAFADRDGAAACERLTAEAREEVGDFISGQTPPPAGAGCAEIIEEATRGVSESQLNDLRDLVAGVKGEDVAIAAGRATFKIEGTNVEVELVKEDGKWRITGETLERSFGQNAAP